MQINILIFFYFNFIWMYVHGWQAIYEYGQACIKNGADT